MHSSFLYYACNTAPQLICMSLLSRYLSDGMEIKMKTIAEARLCSSVQCDEAYLVSAVEDGEFLELRLLELILIV